MVIYYKYEREGGVLEKVLRKAVMPGVSLLCIKTDKFKTGYFSVSLLRHLSSENAAKDCIIPRVLKRGCSRYPDMASLSAALDELYGAVAEPSLRQRGEVLCTGFVSSFVDGRYLPGNPDTLEETVSLVAQLLLDPVTRDGLLNAEYVNSEKEILCDDIRACINDKRAYAARRLRETMCAGEDYKAYAYGSLESVEKINYVTLTRYYREMLADSEIYMFYCGSADIERVGLHRQPQNALCLDYRVEKFRLLFALQKLYVGDLPQRKHKQVPAVVGELVHYNERKPAAPENVELPEVRFGRGSHFQKRVGVALHLTVCFWRFDIRNAPVRV